MATAAPLLDLEVQGAMIYIKRSVELQVSIEDVLKRISVDQVVVYYGKEALLREIESTEPGALLSFLNPQALEEMG